MVAMRLVIEEGKKLEIEISEVMMTPDEKGLMDAITQMLTSLSYTDHKTIGETSFSLN